MLLLLAARPVRSFSGGPAPRRWLSRTPLRMAPEGPEVSCLVDSLEERFGGDRYELQAVRFVSGRYANQSLASTQKAADGFGDLQLQLPLPLKSVNCKGKFIWFDLGRGQSLWSTLGLTGSWRFDRALESAKHVRTVLQLAPQGGGQPHELFYSDMRNFGTLKACASEEELAAKLRSLGSDWLADPPPPFVDFLAAARAPRFRASYMASWLMDQRRFCGVGNYILSEALYRAELYPFARLGDLSDRQLQRLHRAVLFVSHHSRASQAAGSRLPARYDPGQEAGAGLDGFEAEALDLRRHFSAYVGARGGFRFAVYAQQQCPMGLCVVRERGPHGRSLHWVAELQTGGRAEAQADAS